MADRDRPSDSRSSYRETLEEVGPYLGLGLQIGATMAFFVGAGYLVDSWLDTSPWFVLIGAVLGMAALIVQLIQITNRLNDTSRKRQSQGRSRESNVDEE